PSRGKGCRFPGGCDSTPHVSLAHEGRRLVLPRLVTWRTLVSAGPSSLCGSCDFSDIQPLSHVVYDFRIDCPDLFLFRRPARGTARHVSRAMARWSRISQQG